LPGVGDGTVNVAFPENLEIRINGMNERIDPELRLLRSAEDHIERAITMLALPVEALQAWTEADKAYPYVPLLAEVRTRIVGAAQEQLVGRVGNAGLFEQIERKVCGSKQRPNWMPFPPCSSSFWNCVRRLRADMRI
jgi:hypothetical protein